MTFSGDHIFAKTAAIPLSESRTTCLGSHMRILSIAVCLASTVIGVVLTEGAWGADSDPTGRVLSIVQQFTENEEAQIDVSADRRILYVVGYRRQPIVSGGVRIVDARLRIFDVSEPRAPRRLSELLLGDIAPHEIAVRAGRLFFLHWADERASQPRGLAIIDVSNPRAPIIASNIPLDGWQLDVSRDGSLARIKTRPTGELRLKIIEPDQTVTTDEVSDDLEPIENYRQRQLKQVRGSTYDRIGSRVLSADLVNIFVSELGTGEPTLLGAIALGVSAYAGKFLASDDVIAVSDRWGVELVSIAPRTYNAERLRQTHRRLLEQYNEARSRRGSTPENAFAPIALYGQLVALLEDAGVANLLDHRGGGLPNAVRVQILNDYGFWLSRTDSPRTAVPVLSKVVEIDPKRAVAHLNLAEAARASISLAGTWEDKRTLSQTVITAQAAYKRLTGRQASGASEFASFNIANASTGDVCSYVAAFYNRGRQSEIFGYPDPVDIAGDGRPMHVYIYHQGTANVPGIVASTKELEHDEVFFGNPESEVDFAVSGDREDDLFFREPRVLPFKGAYYVVYEGPGPYVVVRPNRGRVCQFKPIYSPVLTENHAPAICEQALAGRVFDRVPAEKLPEGEIPPSSQDLVHTNSATFDVFSDVVLDPDGGSIRVGYFWIASGAGRGCDVNGVAFLKDRGIEDSPRSRALMDAQKRMMNCGGSTAFLVRAGDENLIEVDGGFPRGRPVLPRILLRLRGENVETACKVDQRVEYVLGQPEGLPAAPPLTERPATRHKETIMKRRPARPALPGEDL
jgi:hypothetical protein